MKLALVLTLACAAAAQDPPPETVLLSRIQARLRGQLARLPDYTCLETIARFHGSRGSAPKRLDVVRLEIVYSDRKEWFAAPGDPSFTATDPGGFVAGGLIGNGAFGLTLYNLVSGAATVAYVGRESWEGRSALHYAFHMNRSLRITIMEGRGTTDEAGGFWVDPASLDLLHMEARADNIPAFLPVAGAVTRVTYARVRIGAGEALLPQQGEFELRKASGAIDFDHAEFTHCRAYGAESVLRFGEPAKDAAPAPAPAAPKTPAGVVPAFLPVTVELVTPITEKDAVGARIEARVASSVIRKGAMVLPRGAPVHGRIRRLERYDDHTFALGLEFLEAEAPGGPLRFYADLTGLDPRRPVRRQVSEKIEIPAGRNTYTVTLPELPGVASFFVTGKSFTLPAGFRTLWRTRGLVHQ